MKTQSFRSLHPFLLATVMAACAVLTSCSSPMPVAGSESAASGREYMPRTTAALGTGWGETRTSRVAAGTFERASSRPDGVGELRYYDDTLVDRYGGRDFRGPCELVDGRVSVGLKGERGRWLAGNEHGGRHWIMGTPGDRYEIVVKNLTRNRIEVVVSVDGLDVMDGRAASYSKRGHLIGPRSTVTIPGWRTSMGTVAAFRFAEVKDSYVARKGGDSRNAGVIGVAVFSEKPPSSRRFAQPPPDGPRPNPFPGER